MTQGRLKPVSTTFSPYKMFETFENEKYMMLKYIDEVHLKEHVELDKMMRGKEVYMLKSENNPLSFLKAGSHIRVKREDCYRVFELKVSWDGDKATLEGFVKAVCEEAEDFFG